MATAEPEGSTLAVASFGRAALLAGPVSPLLERGSNPILLQDAPEARQSFGTANMLSVLPVEGSLSTSLTADGTSNVMDSDRMLHIHPMRTVVESIGITEDQGQEYCLALLCCSIDLCSRLV